MQQPATHRHAHRREMPDASTDSPRERLGVKVTAGPRCSCASKKNLAEHAADQATFLDENLKPALAAVQAGQGSVFFSLPFLSPLGRSPNDVYSMAVTIPFFAPS